MEKTQNLNKARHSGSFRNNLKLAAKHSAWLHRFSSSKLPRKMHPSILLDLDLGLMEFYDLPRNAFDAKSRSAAVEPKIRIVPFLIRPQSEFHELQTISLKPGVEAVNFNFYDDLIWPKPINTDQTLKSKEEVKNEDHEKRNSNLLRKILFSVVKKSNNKSDVGVESFNTEDEDWNLVFKKRLYKEALIDSPQPLQQQLLAIESYPSDCSLDVIGVDDL